MFDDDLRLGPKLRRVSWVLGFTFSPGSANTRVRAESTLGTASHVWHRSSGEGRREGAQCALPDTRGSASDDEIVTSVCLPSGSAALDIEVEDFSGGPP